MAKSAIHEGKRSWWDGTVKTLCGLTIEKPQRKWFASVNCPHCLQAMGKN